jgi:hypothetical protein
MMANEKRIPNKKDNNRDTEVVANETAIKYFKQGWGVWERGDTG